jgi:hypothetical protein
MAPRKDRTKDEFVRMYYEHQYDRLAKHESYRLTLTNYVLTISALVFTFGYQNTAQLSVMNGVALPLIIIVANVFAVGYIDRTIDFTNAHQNRAREVLKRYAPELIEINETQGWRKSGLIRNRRTIEKGIHRLLILIACVPFVIFIYQVIW